MLYGVIHDHPSLENKVLKMINVWKDRSIVSLDKISSYEQVIREAISDYNANYDRRHSSNQVAHVENTTAHSHYSDDDDSISAYSNSQAFSDVEEVDGEKEEEALDFLLEEKESQKRQLLTERLILSGSQFSTKKEGVDEMNQEVLSCL